jgi:type II restriction enzyme
MPREALEKSHVGIKLNSRSSKMEKRLLAATDEVAKAIHRTHGLTVGWERRIYVSDLVDELNKHYRGKVPVQFEQAYAGSSKTYIQPDGGFLWIEDWGESPRRFILVGETKRQGTNDQRKREHKKTQAAGNAIERLAKNMRGIDAMFLGEKVTPFVCFGEGCDFAPDCTIIDRVATMNGFFPLNHVFVDKVQVGADTLKPTSLFFRERPRTPQEMYEVLIEVAERSIAYYRKRYRLT